MKGNLFIWDRRGGFTLLEMLLVIGIAVLMMGLSGSAWQGIRRWQAGAESRLLFMELENACGLYRQETGDWPAGLQEGELGLAGSLALQEALAPYLERPLLGTTLRDGFGNTDIRLIVDADGDHWIEASDFAGLEPDRRPSRLWARVVVYSLGGDGRLGAASWDVSGEVGLP